ncbi:uncharacterized protein BX663DRAFT_528960 [Cokeromyces recurvatus]|uniref:uncharacterized protein n=1 Tax=Cokeromyces recurvatus TaxID=90255 RepID=UPI0022205C39|nr:uncharacterized protein BX663DRAFT_528960 [Cokeromyces recurvatus]KAI7907174.1 hypothetical protein BX663DRAFT_528960 [Cokeromyces recurvatus]
MIEELMKGNKENISIVDSTISNSKIIVGNDSGSINITQIKGKRKQGQNQENDSDIVTVKRKKDSFALLKPITPSISYRFNTPSFNEQMKAKVNSIAYIKLDDKDICENESITNEYASLTMLSTSVVSQEKWGYTLVREAIVPRTWNVRVRWLKVMDLIFYTKVEFVLIAILEEQKEVAAILESEHNGWTQVAQGTKQVLDISISNIIVDELHNKG